MTGPVVINIGGKERFLKYDINTAAEMEELLGGRSLMFIMANPAVAGFAALRILLWGGLKHAQKGLTLQLVGVWMQEYMEAGGTPEELAEIIGKAVRRSRIMGEMKEQLAAEPAGDEGNG